MEHLFESAVVCHEICAESVIFENLMLLTDNRNNACSSKHNAKNYFYLTKVLCSPTEKMTSAIQKICVSFYAKKPASNLTLTLLSPGFHN